MATTTVTRTRSNMTRALPRRAVALLAFLFASIQSSVAQPVVVIEEHDFASGSIETFSGGWGHVGGFSTASLSGGNPGGWLQTTVSVAGGAPPAPFTADTTFGVVILSGQTIHPGNLGGVASMRFSLDSRFVGQSPPNVAGCACSGQGAIIRQGGIVYFADMGTTPPFQSAWQHTTTDELEASDFGRLLFQNPIVLDFDQNPDFSASAAPFEVGISRSNSNSAPFFGGYSVTTGLDNLVVSVTGALSCDSIDFNNDTSLFDPIDIDAFLSVYGEGPCIPEAATCNDIDFNNDNSLFDPCDIDAFLLVFSEGPCTLCGL